MSCSLSTQLSQGGEAKGEDRPENAGLKTRDAPIRADAARQDERSEVERPYAYWCDIDLIVYYTTAYSVGVTIVLLTPEYQYRVFKITRLILVLQ